MGSGIVWNGKANEYLASEAHRLHIEAWHAIHDEAQENNRRVQADQYKTMRYLERTLKGLRFYEL